MSTSGDVSTAERLSSWQARQHSLYRSGERYGCEQRWGYFAVYDRQLASPALVSLIGKPEQLMANALMLKDGDSTTVVATEIDGRTYVVKRYNIRNFWYALRRLFRPTRAWHCWRNAHMLQWLGICTPAPVLMIEARWGPLRRVAYFVTEHVVGADVQQELSVQAVDSPRWTQIMTQFSTLFTSFKLYRIVHGDCKATNFIVNNDGLYVLDLDACRQERAGSRFRKYHQRDLQRFKANWRHDELAVNRITEIMSAPETEEKI